MKESNIKELCDTFTEAKHFLEEKEKEYNEAKKTYVVEEDKLNNVLHTILWKIKRYIDKPEEADMYIETFLMFKNSFGSNLEKSKAFLNSFFNPHFKKYVKNVFIDKSDIGVIFKVDIVWGESEQYDVAHYTVRLPIEELNWYWEN